MQFESFIALRYLRAKRKQAFISVISVISIAGVALGVASLIVVMGVMNGFTLDLRDKILGANAQVVVHDVAGSMMNYQDKMEKVAAIPGVKAVTPFVYAEVMLSSRNGAKGLMLRGIDPDTAPKVLGIFDKIVEGNIGALKDTNDATQSSSAQDRNNSSVELPGIVVGGKLASRLGLREGSRVYLLSPSGEKNSTGFAPSTKPFKVVGVFRTGMMDYDTTFAFVSLKTAAGLMGMPTGTITGLELALDDVYSAGKISTEVNKVLGTGVISLNWMENNANLFAALMLEKVAMGIILTLIVLVGSFSIITTLVMLVMEKTRDIAILMSMGATRASIKKIFILQGSIIGFLGTLIGLGLGLLVSFLLTQYKFKLPEGVYSTEYLPVVLQLSDILLVCGGALFICFLATLYPARQASNLEPVEALHYE